jgi:hypothetical protein
MGVADYNGGDGPLPAMTDAETAATIRRWCEAVRGPFSWPTDACGYEQHIRFVVHRNAKWEGGDFKQFCLDYAAALERGEIPPYKPWTPPAGPLPLAAAEGLKPDGGR